MRRRAVVTAAAVIGLAAVACSGPSSATTWTFRTDRPWLPGNSQALTPVADGELAYFCGGYSYDGQSSIQALSLRDGSVRWQHRVGGCQRAPVLVDGTVIVSTREAGDGECGLHGYEPKTGATRWRRGTSCSHSTVAVEDRILFASATGDTMESMGAGGERLARFTFPEARGDRRLWLTRSDGATWFGFGRHVWRWADGSPQPEAASTLELEAEPASYAAVSGGRLVVGGGEKPAHLRAFDLKTGALLWEQPAFSQILSLAAIEGNLFVNIWRKRFELVSLDPATGRELWSAGDGGFHSPTVHGGRIYANGEDSVFAADPATGRILQTFGVGEEVTTTPTVAGDLLLFGTIDGALHAIRTDRLNPASR